MPLRWYFCFTAPVRSYHCVGTVVPMGWYFFWYSGRDAGLRAGSSVEALAPAAAALVGAALEVDPLVADLVIGLQFDARLAPFISLTDKVGQEVLEKQGVDAFRLPFGTHGDEQHVEVVVVLPLQRLQQVPPAEGPQASATLLEGARERRHTNTGADEASVLVGNATDEFRIDGVEIHRDVLLNLPFAQGRVAEQVGIGRVDDLEDVASVGFGNLLAGLELLDLQPVLFLNQVGHAHQSRRRRHRVGSHAHP